MNNYTLDALVILGFLVPVVVLWLVLRPVCERRRKARLWDEWMKRVTAKTRRPLPVEGNRHQRRAAEAINRCLARNPGHRL